MAKKSISQPAQKLDIPKTLDDHIFYGLRLDPDQKKFRDALWDETKRVVFCNAKSGSGKTLQAVAVGLMRVRYGTYDGITYITAPYGYERVGFLPGSLELKCQNFSDPLYQALLTCNENPEQIVSTETMINQKNGTGIVTAIPHTFLRGSNLDNRFIIQDESQNQTADDLKKTLTRVGETSKVVVIGHTGQIDLQRAETSGFERCLNHFASKNDPRCSIHKLTINYRGWVSQTADEDW